MADKDNTSKNTSDPKKDMEKETEARRKETEANQRRENERRENDRRETPNRDTSSTGTVNKSAMRDPKNASSVGATLSEDAKLDGDILDAGGPYVAAAPAPTPAEMVSYPATGGLPDTGPHSKYVLGDDRGVKLFNEDGERVDRDGRLLNEFGDRIRVEQDPPHPDDAKKPIPASIKAEMDAGAAALSRN